MKEERGVVKGKNEGLIGFEELKDEALPVSKSPVCIGWCMVDATAECKTIEKCGEVDCWGRLASGNCSYAPHPPSIVYITMTAFETSSHLLDLQE